MRFSDWSSDVCSSDLVISVFLDEDIGEQRFPRQAARHHIRGSLRLRDAIAARPAHHPRPHRHDDAILGGDDVESLGTILAEPVQRTAAARAAAGPRRDLDLVTRKMRRQRGAGSSAARLRPVGALPVASSPCRSEEHTSELQSLMRLPYAVICLKTKNNT